MVRSASVGLVLVGVLIATGCAVEAQPKTESTKSSSEALCFAPTCTAVGATCGSFSNICGGTTNCGTCTSATSAPTCYDIVGGYKRTNTFLALVYKQDTNGVWTWRPCAAGETCWTAASNISTAKGATQDQAYYASQLAHIADADQYFYTVVYGTSWYAGETSFILMGVRGARAGQQSAPSPSAFPTATNTSPTLADLGALQQESAEPLARSSSVVAGVPVTCSVIVDSSGTPIDYVMAGDLFDPHGCGTCIQ